MMYLTLIFWIIFMLPGYAAVRRWFRKDLECGLLGVIGLSTLASMALLSPVAIVGYTFGLPLWVFSGAIIAAVAWGAYDTSRTGGWRDLWTLARGGACIELVIVVAILLIDVFVGSILHGDATVHLARIRFLVDHGLTNQDPFVAAEAFYPIYHTNILHALYASATQLTFTDHLGVWHMSLGWSKLMCAAGGYLLGWFVFRKSWPAWACALFIIMHRGPVPFTVYPNQLAPFFVLPILIGFVVQAITDGADRRSVIRIGAATLVLGQVHGLYVIFALLALAVPLGVAVVHRWVKKRDDRVWLLAAAAVLLSGLPFPMVSKMTTKPIEYDATNLRGYDENRELFVTADVAMLGEFRMRNPSEGFLKDVYRPFMLLAGIGIGLCTTRRRAVWVVAAIAGVAAISLYVPPTATLLLKTLGREWILVRFEVLLVLCTLATMPAAVSFLAAEKSGQWALRVVLAAAALFCGQATAARFSQNQPTYSWANHFRDGFRRTQPSTDPDAFPPPRDMLENLRRHREGYLELLEPGAVVLANVSNSMMIVALTVATIVYSASSSLGVADQAQRRSEFIELTSPGTAWSRRAQLLHKYRVSYILTVGEPTPDWADRVIVSTAHSAQLDVYIGRIAVP